MTLHQPSKLANIFRDLVPSHLRQWLVLEGDILFRMPSPAEEIGDLVVHDDGDELTVELEDIWHCHFAEWYVSHPKLRERQEWACNQALETIEAITMGKIRFRNEYREGRIIAGGCWNVDEEQSGVPLDAADEWREYTWFGLQLHERRERA